MNDDEYWSDLIERTCAENDAAPPPPKYPAGSLGQFGLSDVEIMERHDRRRGDKVPTWTDMRTVLPLAAKCYPEIDEATLPPERATEYTVDVDHRSAAEVEADYLAAFDVGPPT